MKYLVDTCGWIEWLIDGSLADNFAPFLLEPENLIIPTVQQYELYRWIAREQDTTTALDIIALSEQGKVVNLDTGLSLLAAETAKEYKLAAIDAIIYSTAQLAGVELITSDRHFAGLPEVRYFQKSTN